MKNFQSFYEGASLNHHTELNQKIWNGDAIKPDVRIALLNFANAFREFAKIPKALVKDVILVGGMASYYYTEGSDLDVHLLINKKDLGYGPIVDDFLKDRKTLWSIKHDIRIKGYPVEPYAQDLSEKPPQGQGVYSLLDEEWLQRPIISSYDPTTDSNLDPKIEHWKGVIDNAIKNERSGEEVEKIKDRIFAMRKEGVSKVGELSPDNLVFKTLRNDKYIEKINDYLKTTKEKELSLE